MCVCPAQLFSELGIIILWQPPFGTNDIISHTHSMFYNIDIHAHVIYMTLYVHVCMYVPIYHFTYKGSSVLLK